MRFRPIITIGMLVLGAFAITKAFQIASEVTRNPFTVIMAQQAPPPKGDPGGNQRIMRKLIAVRSDGSNATVSLPQEGQYQGVPDLGDRALTLRQGQIVYVLDRLRIKTTIPIPGAGTPLQPRHPTCDPGEGSPRKLLRKETFQGYETYVYESKTTNSDGEEDTLTRWTAPALNCMPVQARLDRKGKSGEITTMLNYATSITLGEPDPTLFVVPADYREVTPSEREIERARMLGRPAPPVKLMERLLGQDEDYRRARTQTAFQK